MIECKLCKKEFKTKRSFHGHLIRWHSEEYKESGNDDKSFMSKGSAAETHHEEESDLPAGIRLLKRSDPFENEAYKAGYRYIDDQETVYTHEELKEEGILS